MDNKKKKKSAGKSKASGIAMYGVLVALAMIFSYLETLIPITAGIPGIKPGLANIVVFVALYLMTPLDAWSISMIRILLVAFTFGNPYSMLTYSLSGGMLSFLVMWLCKSGGWFGKTGVSIAGGVSHNIGQLAAAAIVLESAAVFAYLPVLLISGVVMGTLTGILGAMIMKRLPTQIW